jgi:hypothetical protein
MVKTGYRGLEHRRQEDKTGQEKERRDMKSAKEYKGGGGRGL